MRTVNPMAGASDLEKEIFEAAQPSYPTAAEIILRSGRNPSTVRKCLEKLEARGVVERIGGGGSPGKRFTAPPLRWKVVWHG